MMDPMPSIMSRGTLRQPLLSVPVMDPAGAFLHPTMAQRSITTFMQEARPRRQPDSAADFPGKRSKRSLGNGRKDSSLRGMPEIRSKKRRPIIRSVRMVPSSRKPISRLPRHRSFIPYRVWEITICFITHTSIVYGRLPTVSIMAKAIRMETITPIIRQPIISLAISCGTDMTIPPGD